MSENGFDKPLRKRTVQVPDRNHTSSQDGALPLRPVSVAAAPWEIEHELNILGVVPPPSEEKKIVKKGARPASLPPDPKTQKGKFYKPGEEPEF